MTTEKQRVGKRSLVLWCVVQCIFMCDMLYCLLIVVEEKFALESFFTSHKISHERKKRWKSIQCCKNESFTTN